MHLEYPAPGQATMALDPGDRVAMVVPMSGPDVIGRVVSPVRTLVGDEREVTWTGDQVEVTAGGRVAFGWVADDSDTVLAYWGTTRVDTVSTDYTMTPEWGP